MNRIITAVLALAIQGIPVKADPLIWAPPMQFRHPYHGKVVDRVLSWQQAMKECDKREPFDRNASACAHIENGICYITRYDHSDDGSRVSPQEIEHIRIHEMAHCNGWPADHAGGGDW